MELALRKQKILSAIVESYIRTGEPVGSKTLLAEAELSVSSATVRNEMAALTDMGLIVQPYTSAGRIPTRQGYRYYIDNIMRVTPLSQGSRDYIESRLYESSDSPEHILQGAADLLSELTGYMALATTPGTENSRVHKISFVQTGSHTAMAVVIVSNGIIKSKLFRCEFLITPEILEVFDKALNKLFVGVKLESINRPFIQTAAAKFGELSLLMPGVLMAISDAVQKAREVNVCRSGQTNILHMPDVNFLTARNVIEFINNTHDLATMLEKLPPDTSVKIGRENSRIELSSSSVISARYNAADTLSGVLALVGPVRMDYGKMIAVIEGVSDCVSGIIGELVEIQ